MRVNFDANASVKPIPEVLECLARYRGEFLNPSSVHQSGQAAKKVLDDCRDEVSALLNLKSSDRIVFTSGATEANNAALAPYYAPANSSGYDLACSSVEHSAVLESLRRQVARGYKLKEISPDQLSETAELTSILNDDLRIFSLMAANNETGQIFDICNISKIIRKISARARIHCDAVQAVGKLKINFSELGVDTLALSGHKLGALSGVGALVISEHCHLEPWIFGGPQEHGLRAGTENVLAIKTLGIACREARKRLLSSDSRMEKAKQSFTSYLKEFGSWIKINQFDNEQIPNTLSIRLPGIKADDLVVAMDLCGVAISAGSACASGRPSPSHVLLAHGMSESEAKETVRISFEPTISESEFEFGLAAFKETISRIASLRRAA